MPTKRKQKRASTKKMQRGTVGNFFVFGVLALLAVLGFVAVGGNPPRSFPDSGQQVIVLTPTVSQNYNTLQLKTFGYVTVAPPPKTGLCKSGGVNDEPEILRAYSPANGHTVGQNGQIKVWVTDEGPPFIAPNEQVSSTSGQIIKKGDRTATAPDGYPFEPALYIAPNTAESGGTPFFPNYIKGQFDNTGQIVSGNKATILMGHVTNGAQIDPLPPGSSPSGSNPNGISPNIFYTAEYTWDVSKLGLAPGTHQAEFLIHDGDTDRGVGCVTINIQ